MSLLKFSLVSVVSAMLMLLNLTTAIADTPNQREYQIELIVFSHPTEKAVDAEAWPRISDIHFDQNGAIQLSSTQTQDENNLQDNTKNNSDSNNYTLLSNNQFILKKEAKRLTAKNYQILLHIAWRENEIQLGNKQTVHIYGGLPLNGSASNTIVSDESIPFNSANPWQLNGLLTIDLNRYFNLHFNLLFAEPSNKVTALSKNDYFNHVSDPYIYFRLLQNRRMRSNELNYIGHPLYGVLVEIKRLPTADTNEQTG